jgi:hypothetical protein
MKVKARKENDYKSLFIKQSDITARTGKTVYVRGEFHERIRKIVQTIGGNEVSIFSYIDSYHEKYPPHSEILGAEDENLHRKNETYLNEENYSLYFDGTTPKVSL